MTALERCHLAIEALAELTGKDLRLVNRRAYFQHKASGPFVAQVDGYQPLLSAAATSPDVAVEELAGKVAQQAGIVKRLKGW